MYRMQWSSIKWLFKVCHGICPQIGVLLTSNRPKLNNTSILSNSKSKLYPISSGEDSDLILRDRLLKSLLLPFHYSDLFMDFDISFFDFSLDLNLLSHDNSFRAFTSRKDPTCDRASGLFSLRHIDGLSNFWRSRCKCRVKHDLFGSLLVDLSKKYRHWGFFLSWEKNSSFHPNFLDNYRLQIFQITIFSPSKQRISLSW
jgi:hypothetical protein